VSSQLYALTIAEAMTLLRKKEVSPVELLDSVLQRLEETEDRVHAYTVVTKESAYTAAEQAEREIARGESKGPLHGIPLALKDLLYTTGVPTEAGSRVLAGFIPPYDSTVTTRLKESGAILIGKTVTQEFAYGMNIPSTRNPWDLERWPGGSSAGSAVAVAVDSAMGAIGTDTGGSIRVPSSLNGVVGLKPTFGRVSKHGVIPMSTTMDHCGPITKTVEDAALLMNVIAGYDPHDTTSLNVPVPDFTDGLDRGIAGLRLGVERNHFFYSEVLPAVRRAVESALSVLESQGATLVDVEIPYLEYAPHAGLTLIMVDTSSYHQAWLRERPEEYDPRTRFMLEVGEFILATDYLRALQVRKLFKGAMKEVFDTHRLDALVTPTIPITTVPVNEMSVTIIDMEDDGETILPALVHHCTPFNLSGQPALTLPCGFDDNRLPIGLQIVGRPFDEPTVLRIGYTYESATSWHREAPPI